MNGTRATTIEPDRILQAHATYAELAAAFADLRTSKGTQAALALTIAASYALDVAVRLTTPTPPSLDEALRSAAEGGLPLNTTPAAARSTSADDEMIDTVECARRLRCSVPTLRTMAKSNKIPARKVGRGYLYPWAAVCQWLGGDRPIPTPPPAHFTQRTAEAASPTKAADVSTKLRALRTELRYKQRSRYVFAERSTEQAQDEDAHAANRSAQPKRHRSSALPLDPAERAAALHEKLRRPPTDRFKTERLTDEQCAQLTRGGRYHDGAGLYLQVQRNSRSWILRFEPPGREIRVYRYLGLGRYPDISLAEARQKAAMARALIAAGVDPIERRRAEEAQRVKSTERDRNPAPTV